MLFNETKLSGITLKNRIIRSATHDGLAIEKEPTRCLYGKVK